MGFRFHARLRIKVVCHPVNGLDKLQDCCFSDSFLLAFFLAQVPFSVLPKPLLPIPIFTKSVMIPFKMPFSPGALEINLGAIFRQHLASLSMRLQEKVRFIVCFTTTPNLFRIRYNRFRWSDAFLGYMPWDGRWWVVEKNQLNFSLIISAFIFLLGCSVLCTAFKRESTDLKKCTSCSFHLVVYVSVAIAVPELPLSFYISDVHRPHVMPVVVTCIRLL